MFCYSFASPVMTYFFFITNVKFIAMNHILKIKEVYYNHILSGEKTWELRRNDRDFKIGDTLEFVIVENDIVVSFVPIITLSVLNLGKLKALRSLFFLCYIATY